MQHAIGDEFTWTREGMAERLCEDGIKVKGVTTDQDSSPGRAADRLPLQGLAVQGQANALPGYSASLRKYQEIYKKRRKALTCHALQNES